MVLRALALLASLLVAAALAPAASAHEEDAVNHFTLTVDDLAPGATREIHATFEGGPLREGWVFILVGGTVSGAPLEVDVSLNGTSIGSWRWTGEPGAIHLESLALPETSLDYVITLKNPGTEDVRFFFYFDQSCDCFAKPLPFTGAYAIFNFDFLAGETVHWRFDTNNVTLTYDVLVRNGDGGDLAKDFTTIKSSPKDASPNGTVTWKADGDRTYYVLARATSSGAEPMAAPRFYVDAPGGEKRVPAPAALVTLAALGAAAAGAAASARRR